MPGDRARLAAALADAFLAGEWTPDGLRTQGELVLESRHGWLRRLVREVLAAYPAPPSDRPRELLAFVLQTGTMVEIQRRADRRSRPLPLPLHRLTVPTSMVRRPFPVAPLDHAGDLAELLGVSLEELLWFADTKRLLRRAPSKRLQHYRSTWIPSSSGGRLLEAPLPRLKAIQRQLLEQVLMPIPVHQAAHGFVAGRSARTGAAPHVGSRWVISLDLESFFASISAGRVYGVFRVAGYPEPVAHLLTGLCTHASAVRALAAMPGSPAESSFRLRRRLAQPHLPQGAPTSPLLANLCAFTLDRRLSAYASAVGARYTRYADDLTFSGASLAVAQRGIIAAVSRIVVEEGFLINRAKTRTRGSDSRQEVTGIVVNSSTNVCRKDYDTLRAVLHNCVVLGPSTQNRMQHNDFRSHLRGRIAWVASLDAERGGRLLATFDRIDWS